jgi:hypothetical protein
LFPETRLSLPPLNVCAQIGGGGGAQVLSVQDKGRADNLLGRINHELCNAQASSPRGLPAVARARASGA